MMTAMFYHVLEHRGVVKVKASVATIAFLCLTRMVMWHAVELCYITRDVWYRALDQ